MHKDKPGSNLFLKSIVWLPHTVSPVLVKSKKCGRDDIAPGTQEDEDIPNMYLDEHKTCYRNVCKMPASPSLIALPFSEEKFTQGIVPIRFWFCFVS